MDLNETRERIIYEKQGPIAKITLNWPEKANAQDQKLVEEVDAALVDADRDYDIKVLILKANGKGFCSGHAIGDNATDYPAMVEGHQHMGTPWKPQTDLFLKPTLNLWEFSKPTIAQVHGYCLLPVLTAARVRHAVRGVLDRAVGLHELAARGVLPVHVGDHRRPKGARGGTGERGGLSGRAGCTR